ncbi:MAG TPA: hypothetical protein VG796_09605 [Verrucomicrobiales bacterium]|nr:hypothetical protein [Verrucomicrobiales bacterium]
MDWEDADLWDDSSIRLERSARGWHLLLTTLYPPGVVLWIGHPHESGPGHESHFQTRDQWLDSHPGTPPCPFICPDTFLPGACHRHTAGVAASPYLVVEADEALGRKPATGGERAENLRRNLCILRWLHETLAWPLRAIIHTGGKSCHGWFERPRDTALQDLKALAPALGIDASVFIPAHPVRLPSVVHEKTGVKSRLLYLSPGVFR